MLIILIRLPWGGAVARLTGVGGRDSRRQAYMDVFTASFDGHPGAEF
ncbi:MAG: hypothetical protein IBX56_01985 [Methylomicrobium sp.]|nr:hypothetical protein [Methylomicrobium sp.]